jgi:hypothetical protein
VTALRPLLAIAIVAAVAATLSVVAGPNLAVALLLGGAAAFGAGVVALLVLGERIQRTVGRPVMIESESLVTLRDALSSGSLGRERIIAAVRALEWGQSIRDPSSAVIDDDRRLLDLPAGEFRSWLAGRLERLERET